MSNSLATTALNALARGAIEVVENSETNVPFKMYRNSMYTQVELLQVDQKIYSFIHTAPRSSYLIERAMHLHDFSLRMCLKEYVKGKRVVVIFGGHAMKRSSLHYKNVVLLAKV
jgi:hypothetical protein